MNKLFSMLTFNSEGLIPAVIQDARTKKVLTLCYMNKEALRLSLRKGLVHVYRRSKSQLMMKGKHSGCVQKVKKLYIDCEGKSLLISVRQVKAACHKGYFTCYFRNVDRNEKMKIIGKRLFDPNKVYRQ